LLDEPQRRFDPETRSAMTHSRARTIWMAVALLCASVGVASAEQQVDRTVLPIQEPDRKTYSERWSRRRAPCRRKLRLGLGMIPFLDGSSHPLCRGGRAELADGHPARSCAAASWRGR
jgi:hypothetical protein